MTNTPQDHVEEDAIEPVELGSVSEETRGFPNGDFEIVGGLSRNQPG
jgi:hypothetical protein